MSCRSEVSLTIIEAVAVDMVAHHSIGSIRHFAMHADHFSPFTVSVRASAYGVRVIANSCGEEPIVFAQPVIVVRIDDCEFAPAQRYSPEGVAVAQPAV